MGIRRALFVLVDEENEAGSKLNSIFGMTIIVIIIFNVIGIIAESFETFEKAYRNELVLFELISVIVFTFEYIARILTADMRRPDLSKPKAVGNFVSSPMAIIDVLAIAPFFIELALKSMSIDLRSVRALRLLRLLRLFKLGRYSKSIQMMADVMREKAAEMGVALFVTGILLTIASVLMYYLEHDVQPDQFPNILATFWWAICTLTTVGYGDVFPVTGWGQFVGGIIAILGIGMVALPTGIISSAFVEKMNDAKELDEAKDPFNFCPHCGERLPHP